MMKKFLATSMASAIVGSGVLGLASSDEADAAEKYSEPELAQMAQSNDSTLNQSPIEDGDYDYTFTQCGYTYHIESHGGDFSWSYSDGEGDSQTSNETKSNETSNTQSTEQHQSNEVANSESETPEPVKAPKASGSDSQSASSSELMPSHLELIKQRESGGDYSAVNASSGASGAYQFLQSTWDSVAPSDWVGKSPASAPESVQDQAAMKLYDGGSGAGHWVTA